MRKIISTNKAPKAVGPYSQAVVFGEFIFLSGQVSINPESGELEKGTVREQTERTLSNIKAVLEEAGGSMDNVLKCNVYLKDIGDFNDMNEIYSKFFQGGYPARLCVSKVDIFGDLAVEIDVIAAKK